MTWQVEHNAKRGMGKAPGQPLVEQSRISKAILPRIGAPGRCEDEIVGQSALLQEEQGILEPAQAAERRFRGTGKLGCVAAAYLARQDLALSAHHLRRMHRRVAQPGLLELLSGDLQHAAFAVKLALPHRCDRGLSLIHI